MEMAQYAKVVQKFRGTGSKASSSTVKISMAYDMLHDYVFDASITLLSTDECTHAFGYIEATEKGIAPAQTLYLFERGYPSKKLIRRLSNQSHHLVRVKAKISKKIDELPLESRVITMVGDIRARIFKFKLPSGKVEKLIANLFDFSG